MNGKFAAELPHPCDHHWDADSQAERRPVLVSRGFLSSLPVVAGHQTQPLAHTSAID
jgi:hypothetical protein